MLKHQRKRIRISEKWLKIIKPTKDHGLTWNTDKKWVGVWGGRGGAKSHVVATLVKDLCQASKTRVIYLREIQKSIKDSVYSLVEGKVTGEGDGKWKCTESTGEIKHKGNGSYITFWGMRGGSKQEEKTRAKSIEDFDLAVIEEAQACTDYTINLFFPSIRKEGSRIMSVWNTDLAMDPIRKKIEDSKFGILLNVNYLDNPMLSAQAREEAEEMRIKEPELYRHIYLGAPRNQSGNSIIARARLYEAYTRSVKAVGGMAIGADIARFGDDKIIFYARKGLKVIARKEYSKQGIIETGRKLIEFADEIGLDKAKDIPLKIDDSGLGGGVTDYATEKGYNGIPVNFGEKAKNPDKYADVISEMWFEFEKIIDACELIETTELTEDLTGREYTYTTKEQKRVEPKKDFKKRFGRSPDDGDALLLCFYNPGFQIPDMSEEKIITSIGNVDMIGVSS